jgi:regulatory protein
VFEKKQTDKITNPEIALIKMQSWCAYQERCQQEARDKLYGFGLWPDAVENIISSLIESNFLNEERFAIQFVHGKHSIKKWGRIKIKIELKQKRVSDYCIKKAMAQIDDTEYMTTLRKLMETKQRLTNEKNPIKLKLKVLNYALSKGYERDLVFDVLND